MQLPQPFIENIHRLLGAEEGEQLLNALLSEQPISIRINEEKVPNLSSALIYNKVPWCATGCYVLVGGIFLYIYFTFGRILYPKAGHIMEITMQAVVLFLLLMFIEWNVGWKGWSLSIGLPIINAVLLFLTLLMMLFDRKNWQTYLLLLLFSLLTATVNMVLAFVGISASFVLCCGVFAVALFLLFGALFLGERTASNELKWKFHI